MEKLNYLLFENPTKIIVVLAVIEAVLLWVYHKSLLTKRKWILAICPVLILISLGLSHFVNTDREKILRICDDIELNLNEGKVRPLAVYVDGEFKGPYLVSDITMRLAEGLLKTHDISSVKTKVLALRFLDDQAVMRSRGTFHSRAYGRVVFVESNTYWIKRDDGWKIIELTDPEFVDPRDNNDNWRDKLEFPDR